jgi:hypothetical protein
MADYPAAINVKLTARQSAALDLVADRVGGSRHRSAALRMLLEAGIAHSPVIERELEERGHGVPIDADALTSLVAAPEASARN